jgi:hypothetical protein
MDAFLNRYSVSAHFTMLIFFLYTMGLVIMIVNTVDSVCDRDEYHDKVLRAFAAGFFTCRFTLLCLLAFTFYHNKVVANCKALSSPVPELTTHAPVCCNVYHDTLDTLTPHHTTPHHTTPHRMMVGG